MLTRRSSLLLASSALTLCALIGGCGDDPAAEGGGGPLVPGAEGGTDSGDAGGGQTEGGVATTFTVGGTVTGLAAGATIVLQNNGGDAITITKSGAFTFATRVPGGGAFDVSVKTQPTMPPQKCTVSGGAGKVASGNVTSVTVNCATDRFTVGGTISGLVDTVVLSNNNGPDLFVNMNGKFAFPETLESAAAYDVKVRNQPVGPTEFCAVTSGTGKIAAADVTSVVVVCTTAKQSISVNVTGLQGGTVVLQNKGGDDLTIAADGTSTFATTVDSGATYDVKVLTEPTGKSCIVRNGTGTIESTPVTNVTVTCTSNLPNCAGLSASCGPAATSDCCASANVPGGTFSRSYDGVTAGFTDPQFVATVSDFRLDTYEITVSRFRAFVAGYPANRPALGTGKNPNDATDPGWDDTWNTTRLSTTQAALISTVKTCGAGTTWKDVPGTTFEESRAMNCIDWYQAFAFCIWDGGRLPTEAEWNYAAAGGDEQRAYPWSAPPTSKTIDATYAVYNNAPAWDIVGSRTKGDARWGHADMAGNVWEWTLDWARTPYLITPCNDCANFVPTSMHVLRGGGINNPSSLLLSSYRGVAPATRAFDIGVRCARTPE